VYRTILVPLDGSRFSEYALPWALALARRHGAGLALTTVADLAPPMSGGGDGERVPTADGRERGMALAEEYLQGVEERIRGTGFGGQVAWTVLPPGNVAASLVRHLGEVEAELTVMTTHGRGPLQRAWLGSSADGYIRRSPRPVLLIRPEDEAEGEDGPLSLDRIPDLPRRVALPLDGSRAGERLVEYAPGVADPDARYLLVRAIPPMLPGGSPYLPHVVREQEDHERVRRAAREYLEGVAAGLPQGRAEVRVPTSGQAGEAILDLAGEEDVDLIAMSTSGRGGVARLLLGSVADKVIRGAPCPVLLYRAPESD
jgi:nucleotide-binding universal stress UspA family protein